MPSPDSKQPSSSSSSSPARPASASNSPGPAQTGSTEPNSPPVYRLILPPLRSYQIELYHDHGNEVVCISSTQVGKTFAYAAKLIAAMWEYRGAHSWCWYAPIYRQSKAAQRVMYEIAHSAGIMLSGPRPPFKTNPPPPLVLINGSECDFRTWDNPQNLMGDPIAGGVVDEAGLLTGEAQGAISTRRSFTLGPLWYIGNPGMSGGPFRRLCAAAERDGRLHRWTWETLYDWYAEHHPDQAARYKAFIANERESLPEFEFRRLYEAEWVEDEAAVFRGLDQCLANGAMLEPGADNFVLGVDVAQLVDYLAVASMGIKSRRIELRYRFRGIGYPQAAQRIKAIQDHLNAPVVVEINGPGIALVQEFDRIGVRYLPFTTTSQSKQELMLTLAADIQHQRVEIAKVEPMPYEMSIYRYMAPKVAGGGAYRYSAPEGEHDDTVMAAALARWGVAHAITDLDSYGWM